MLQSNNRNQSVMAFLNTNCANLPFEGRQLTLEFGNSEVLFNLTDVFSYSDSNCVFDFVLSALIQT